MTGAYFLTKNEKEVEEKKSYIVADIGGTTLDLGEVKKGLATESKNSYKIADVRTNFKRAYKLKSSSALPPWELKIPR